MSLTNKSDLSKLNADVHQVAVLRKNLIGALPPSPLGCRNGTGLYTAPDHKQPQTAEACKHNWEQLPSRNVPRCSHLVPLELD